jgi:hypothetical protein
MSTTDSLHGSTTSNVSAKTDEQIKLEVAKAFHENRFITYGFTPNDKGLSGSVTGSLAGSFENIVTSKDTTLDRYTFASTGSEAYVFTNDAIQNIFEGQSFKGTPSFVVLRTPSGIESYLDTIERIKSNPLLTRGAGGYTDHVTITVNGK